jgi:hypothetical protein
MGWQADRGPWPGGIPGEGDGMPGQPWQPSEPAGFEHGGPWDGAAPSASLAAALEAAAGAGDRYDGADVDALVGIARQWAAIESWAAAGQLAALRAMTREDSQGDPLLRRRPDLPDGWDDSLTYEVAGALAMGPVSAGNLAHLAWTLGMRLPGIGRLLADGTLTRPKAKLVAQTFEPLDEGEAARAEALILGELAGKTYPQVQRLAWRAALAVAPDAAERRRTGAERDHARVTIFREESGAVGLSGRDLPAAEALAGHASVVARADLYEASGAFPGQAINRLQALAYLHLLNGVSAADAIAFARTADASGTDVGAPDGDDQGPDSGGDPGSDPGPFGGPRSGAGPGPTPGGDGGNAVPASRAVLPEVTVPLATLQGQAERAGDNRLFGPLDPALARDLAVAAARSPASRWDITVVDENGFAVGHGTARPANRRRQPPRPPGQGSCALPARVNITVTENYLYQLAAQPRSGVPSGDWHLAPTTATNTGDGYGSWALTLPGGQDLAVRLDMVPTHACDHRHQVSTYQPSEKLRRLVQVRDHECTFPPCSRAARDSDFEHAVPYDKGGATDACNAGARSRRCHQVKQMPGWMVTQPKPGWHVWTTPSGRTYVQEPWRYTA